MGFNNVIDAFLIFGPGEVPVHFFVDEREQRKGITITGDLFAQKEQIRYTNLSYEVEPRWRLVETAWSLELFVS